MSAEKPIHTLVLDTGPIIRNHPTVSSLLAQCEEIITVPAIISEIKDSVTRARVETTLVPFLKLRAPTEASFKFVSDFARKTGDAAVLSRVDLQIAALAYEVECERNGGDWRLRNLPGQKRVNGAPPKKDEVPIAADTTALETSETTDGPDNSADDVTASQSEAIGADDQATTNTNEVDALVSPTSNEPLATVADATATELPNLSSEMEKTSLQETDSTADAATEGTGVEAIDSPQPTPEDSPETEPGDGSDESDGGEWITPTNLKKRQAADKGATTSAAPAVMQVATLTTDNALQNLLLQINLNLLSSSLSRISQIRNTLLRCHACFLVHKQPDLQFCQRCGKPTLTRVTVTTSSSGEVKVHLKKNMQWSSRGEKYSIPKPVHGSANGRIKGGGKNGWGNGLVLTEDQKEYQRHEERRVREEKRGHGLMDEDYLPGILTGKRAGREGGRLKVGAGRDVNSKKR